MCLVGRPFTRWTYNLVRVAGRRWLQCKFLGRPMFSSERLSAGMIMMKLGNFLYYVIPRKGLHLEIIYCVKENNKKRRNKTVYLRAFIIWM